MDGFGLVRRLREDSTTAAIPVIFNTGIHLDHQAMALAEAMVSLFCFTNQASRKKSCAQLMPSLVTVIIQFQPASVCTDHALVR
jgi:CheY-like chemotaxis protein